MKIVSNFFDREYILIVKIPITPSLCNDALPQGHYECTQPKKEKRIKKVPL
jgi:hypothetical protein